MESKLFGQCPYVTAQTVVQGKWAILILHDLSKEPVRFNTLLRILPSMTHATLARQLKQLQEYGLIVRKEYPQIPPKVEYSLSELGQEFLPTLDAFHQFGMKYMEYLNNQNPSRPDPAQSESEMQTNLH